MHVGPGRGQLVSQQCFSLARGVCTLTAAAAVVAKYKEGVLKHQAFNQASSALAKALLVSVGDENQTHLRTTFVNVKIYALTPAQIVTTMIAK